MIQTATVPGKQAGKPVRTEMAIRPNIMTPTITLPGRQVGRQVKKKNKSMTIW